MVILAIAVCATLAGSTSFVEIAEWGADLSQALRDRLRIGRVPPREMVIRRTLALVDAEVLDRCVSAWIAAQSPAVYADSVSTSCKYTFLYLREVLCEEVADEDAHALVGVYACQFESAV